MKKKSGIEWWVDGKWLFIRFTNVERQEFHTTLKKLKSKISEVGLWRNDLRAWQIPKNDMQTVALFAYHHFGNNSLFARDNYVPPEQLSLFK